MNRKLADALAVIRREVTCERTSPEENREILDAVYDVGNLLLNCHRPRRRRLVGWRVRDAFWYISPWNKNIMSLDDARAVVDMLHSRCCESTARVVRVYLVRRKSSS